MHILTYWTLSRKNTWIWPASLLGVSTLIIGVVAYGVLKREASRLRELSTASAQEQARAVSENIGLIVSEIKLGVMGGLEQFGTPEKNEELKTWVAGSPDLDFAFRWDVENPSEIVIYSQEEETRYARAALGSASQGWLWQRPSPPETAPQASAAFGDADAAQAGSIEGIGRSIDEAAIYNYAPVYEQRQQIRTRNEAAKQATLSQFKKESPQGTLDSTRWIPTRVNGLYSWIGVAYWNSETVVTGAGFSVNSIKEAIRSSFPASKLYGAFEYELIDELGGSFLRVGSSDDFRSSSESAAPSGPSFHVDLGSQLPGWRLGVSVADRSAFSSLFVVFWASLSAGLLLTVAGAGAWLVWQTRSSQLEAAKQSSFVTNVSHELKTPLTTIRMYSELVRDGRLENDEKRSRYLSTIVSECERLTRLVNNVLDFSRLRQGRRKVELNRLSLSGFLQTFVERIGPGIRNEGMALEADLDGFSGDAVFDEDGLSQILVNLVDNAVKYASEGGWIGLSIRETDSHVVISICDRGGGLPTDRGNTLFQPFERGDKTLVSEKSGFGLGLSIARGLALEMGGFLNYRNGQEGACFEIGLRRVEE